MSKEEYTGQFITPQTMALDEELAAKRTSEGQIAIAKTEAEKNVLIGQFETEAREEYASEHLDTFPPLQGASTASTTAEQQVSQSSALPAAQQPQPQQESSLVSDTSSWAWKKIKEDVGEYGTDELPTAILTAINPVFGLTDWADKHPWQAMALSTVFGIAGSATRTGAGSATHTGGYVYGKLAAEQFPKATNAAKYAASFKWTPTIGQIIKYAATMVTGRSASGVILRGLAGGTLIKVVSDSRAIASAADVEIDDIIGKVEDGKKSYAQGQKEFADMEAAINSAEMRIKWLKHITPLATVTGAKDTLFKFEVLNANMEERRRDLLAAAEKARTAALNEALGLR